MIRWLGIFWWVVLGLMISISSAPAFGPINLNLSNQTPGLVDVSFFGRPYPYGYTGWGPCVRYVEVETRWGLRLRRVRVCR
jgi:hypothetical protein